VMKRPVKVRPVEKRSAKIRPVEKRLVERTVEELINAEALRVAEEAALCAFRVQVSRAGPCRVSNVATKVVGYGVKFVRKQRIRIISARKADGFEREAYWNR
jgi:uncharacterized DUF497 family protein